MPSTTDKQKKFMRAAAEDPSFAKKSGIPQSVAKEFEKADESKPNLLKKSRLNTLYKDSK